MSKLDVIERGSLLEEVERVYYEHYQQSYDQAIHDFFNAVKRRIRRYYPEDAVPLKQHLELKDKYNKLCETAGIIDTALREYQTKYEDPTACGEWEFWEGWVSNHDMRIDDATCSNCGYKHPTIRRTPWSDETALDVVNKLSNFCANCGARMSIG